MKILFYLALSLFSMSSLIEAKETEYTARITYYTDDPKWGNQVACQETNVAKRGVTVAAHPDFRFGTKVVIPGLKNEMGDADFIVQDRGSAVTSKKASKGKTYVFDVYVSSRAELRRLANNLPMYMKVIVKQ